MMSFAGLNFSPTSDAPLSAIPVVMIPLSFNACDGTCAFLPSSLSLPYFFPYIISCWLPLAMISPVR